MRSIIIGTSGNFSIELQKKIPKNFQVLFGRQLLEMWNENSSKKVFIDHLAKHQATNLIYTLGITSPKESLSSLRRINFEFPRYLYSVSKELEMNFVTLGSVHENYPSLFSDNNYISVKKELNQFLKENSFKKSYHFQFHTWYGGERLKNDMFLGQIVLSLKNRSVFTMSSGQQLREYHHVEDDAICVLKMLRNLGTGCYTVSHGEYLTLRQIAHHIFKYFEMEHLLRIDMDNIIEGDITSIQNPNNVNSQCYFRPSLEGIVKYIETKL